MDHNVVEILVILMREYPEGVVAIDEFDPLTKDLMGQGYTHHEIETALFWFHNRSEMQEVSIMSDEFDTNSVRVLHDMEKVVVSPQAFGHLIELKALGLINLADLNNILEKAMILGGTSVNLDDIKMLAAAQILEQDNSIPMMGQSYFIKKTTDMIQ